MRNTANQLYSSCSGGREVLLTAGDRFYDNFTDNRIAKSRHCVLVLQLSDVLKLNDLHRKYIQLYEKAYFGD